MKFLGLFKTIGKDTIKVVDILGHAGVPVAQQAAALHDAIDNARNSTPGTVAADQHAATAHGIVDEIMAVEARLPAETQIVLKKKLTMALVTVVGVFSAMLTQKLGIPEDIAKQAMELIVILGASYIGVEGLLDRQSMNLNKPPSAPVIQITSGTGSQTEVK